MGLPRTLFESPTGLVHIAHLIAPATYHPHERATTECGREVNMETWTRIRTYDEFMFGKGPRAIAEKLELLRCEKCFHGH